MITNYEKIMRKKNVNMLNAENENQIDKKKKKTLRFC